MKVVQWVNTSTATVSAPLAPMSVLPVLQQLSARVVLLVITSGLTISAMTLVKAEPMKMLLESANPASMTVLVAQMGPLVILVMPPTTTESLKTKDALLSMASMNQEWPWLLVVLMAALSAPVRPIAVSASTRRTSS